MVRQTRAYPGTIPLRYRVKSHEMEYFEGVDKKYNRCFQ